MSDELAKLTEAFAKFPGIGSRQAQRMVYYLLRQNKAWVDDLASAMKVVKSQIATCTHCYRHFIPKQQQRLCTLCASETRDESILMVVEKDMDLDNIERSGVFQGKYFVLGGTVSALEKEPYKRIRMNELKARISPNLTEVILALSATPDGDDTVDFIKQELAGHFESINIIFSTRGRGLSTGSELEYADKETLREALTRRV
jgi:recombination protein RecR